MSDIISVPSGSSKTNSIDWLGNAVPLYFKVSPGSNFKFEGAITITFDDSIDHVLTILSRPSVISAVYLPNGVSRGTIMGSANFQFPLASTSAVLVLITSSSGFFTDAVIALPGVAVPDISKKSPLYSTSGTPLIVSCT